jgi:glycerophosphoryl diester phosphodiesterase
VAGSSRAADYPFFDNGGVPIAFAHRGGSLTGDAPGLENTMAAFQVAVNLGYEYVETDVHATRDGVLVAFHDPTLERTTDAEGLISDLTYGDLASVQIAGREAIPRLTDLFETWPDLRINIDAKSAAAVGLLARAIDEHQAWDRVCVASFSPVHLRQLRRLLGPRVATSYSVLGAAALRLLPTPLLRSLAVGHVAQVAQVPVRRGPFEVVTPAFIDHAHALGKHVHAWTINSPADMNRWLDLGVDALVTDRIDTLRDVYRARGIWTDQPKGSASTGRHGDDG